MKLPSFLLILCFLSGSVVSTAQYYETGQDPASLKWLQIKTDRFKVIYPESYGTGGVDFAKSLDQAYSSLISIYPDIKFRIPVIIHNHTIQSNGYVAWAPRRMEIYPTPEQNTIPLDPNKQLTIHELTHVLQMKSLHSGFTKAFSFLLGEQFTGVVASMLPLWLLEGEAVFTESILTESGRGRSSSFLKQLKAIMIEKGEMYKYDKIVNGSFRNFVPDYYQSGFQMIAWSRLNYDPQLWNNVLNYTGSFPFTINPVNISLTKEAGITKKKLFDETFRNLKTLWELDITRSAPETYQILNPDKKGKFINYFCPVNAGPDSIIAVKTSLSEPPSFVLINPFRKTEKRLHTPGRVYPRVISAAKNKIVWAETKPDPRWENLNYSVIKVMDIDQNRIVQLTRNSRYMSVGISPDGNYIAAAENTVDNKNSLVIIDAWNGDILKRNPVPGNAYLQRPQWSDEGNRVTVIFLTDKGEGIMSFNMNDNSWKTFIEAGNNDLQSSYLRNDSLFFVSSSTGTDNIFVLSPERKITCLTRSRFGAGDLNVNGGTLIFSDYSSSGNDICFTGIHENTSYEETNRLQSSFLINNIKPPVASSNDSLKATEYNPEPYRKWLHLFGFHSWMPFYADIDEIQSDPASVRPGFTLMSQNHLSTFISSIGYEYSPATKHNIHTRVTWQGWLPVLESRIDYGGETIINKLGQSVNDPSDIKPDLYFTNTIYLPLTFSSGKFSQYLQPSVSAVYRNRYIYSKETENYDYGQTQIYGRFYFSNYYTAAFRDIYPRWAQVLDLHYSYAPFDKKIYGTMTTFKTAFYFPGLFPSNGIKIRLEKEIQQTEEYVLANRVPFPRSYKDIASENLEFFSVDYVMPLVYPDFNIGSFIYLTRIRTGLFYDYAKGTTNYHYIPETGPQGDVTYSLELHDYTEYFRSFGFELLSDFYLFRIPFMISAGVQTAWQEISKSPSIELLFSIDIFGMNIGKTKM
jgi:hypothetical protein